MVRPRKEVAIDIRSVALVSGLTLLERCGSTDFTLSELAAQIGCKAPALYNYFSNKGALLQVLRDDGFRQLFADYMLPATQGEGPALERLRQSGHAYVRFALANPSLYRLMFAPPIEWRADCEGVPPDARHNSFGLLVDALQACQRDGQFTKLDAASVAFTLWSALHGAIDLNRQSDPALRQASGGVAAIVDNLISLLMTGERP